MKKTSLQIKIVSLPVAGGFNNSYPLSKYPKMDKLLIELVEDYKSINGELKISIQWLSN